MATKQPLFGLKDPALDIYIIALHDLYRDADLKLSKVATSENLDYIELLEVFRMAMKTQYQASEESWDRENTPQVPVIPVKMSRLQKALYEHNRKNNP